MAVEFYNNMAPDNTTHKKIIHSINYETEAQDG